MPTTQFGVELEHHSGRIHGALDWLGAIPGPIGIIADGINAGLYFARGDLTNAWISFGVIAAPFVAGGVLRQGAKIVRGARNADTAAAVGQVTNRIRRTGDAITTGARGVTDRIPSGVSSRWANRGQTGAINPGNVGGVRSTTQTPSALPTGPRPIAAIGPAGNAAARSLDDLASLRGATPESIQQLIPDNWISKPLKKGEGVRYLNRSRPGEAIMIEKGWPGATDPLHSGPYLRVSRGGEISRIPLHGNPTW